MSYSKKFEVEMEHDKLTIPKQSLKEILKAQPESVIYELFESLMVSSDTSPLTEEEKADLQTGREEYFKGETIQQN
jgi:hypothetical protein